jgi:hypothetical protein
MLSVVAPLLALGEKIRIVNNETALNVNLTMFIIHYS